MPSTPLAAARFGENAHHEDSGHGENEDGSASGAHGIHDDLPRSWSGPCIGTLGSEPDQEINCLVVIIRHSVINLGLGGVEFSKISEFVGRLASLPRHSAQFVNELSYQDLLVPAVESASKEIVRYSAQWQRERVSSSTEP